MQMAPKGGDPGKFWDLPFPGQAFAKYDFIKIACFDYDRELAKTFTDFDHKEWNESPKSYPGVPGVYIN